VNELSYSAALPRRVDWDGRALFLQLGAAREVELWLDGVRYARLTGDAAGELRLPLPFLPNGRARVNLELRAEGAVAASVALRAGQPGLGRAAAVTPLLPMAEEHYVDIAANATALAAEVAIVVPVYNAPQAVRACLDSVLAHTRGAARLIVIDDASPDADVAALLQTYRGRRGVELLRNEVNLGFTATANRGIAAAGRADVVLLNADTEVAPHWLPGLRQAAYAQAQTGSATAVSDNAGAFSVPELEQENAWPAGWGFTQAALALWQQAGRLYPRLPTGNGFCMYLRRAALDAVGALDAAAFPQGYGEENDWCQRSEAAGWQHVIAGNVLVRHARSQSFGAARRETLGQAGMAVLRERWPAYEADVGASLFAPRRRVLDWRVRRAYGGPAPLPRQLCWAGAGAAAEHDNYRCHAVPGGWLLQRQHEANWTEVEFLPLDNVSARCGGADLTAAFARLLQRHAISRIAGELPAALAAAAALLQVDSTAAAAVDPFGAAA
jgi:GT2 family glycosyltransferase